MEGTTIGAGNDLRQSNVNWNDVLLSLQGVVLQKYDELTGQQQHILKIASVYGEHFSRKLMLRLVPFSMRRKKSELYAHFQFLVDQDYFEPDDEETVNKAIAGGPGAPALDQCTYSFAFERTRQLIYGLITKAKLREMHIQVADMIKTEYDDDLHAYFPLLARHYALGADKERELVMHDHGARAAFRTGHVRQGIHHLSAALELSKECAFTQYENFSDEKLAAWRLNLGAAYWTTGDSQQAKAEVAGVLQILQMQIPTVNSTEAQLMVDLKKTYKQMTARSMFWWLGCGSRGGPPLVKASAEDEMHSKHILEECAASLPARVFAMKMSICYLDLDPAGLLTHMNAMLNTLKEGATPLEQRMMANFRIAVLATVGSFCNFKFKLPRLQQAFTELVAQPNLPPLYKAMLNVLAAMRLAGEGQMDAVRKFAREAHSTFEAEGFQRGLVDSLQLSALASWALDDRSALQKTSFELKVFGMQFDNPTAIVWAAGWFINIANRSMQRADGTVASELNAPAAARGREDRASILLKHDPASPAHSSSGPLTPTVDGGNSSRNWDSFRRGSASMAIHDPTVLLADAYSALEHAITKEDDLPKAVRLELYAYWTYCQLLDDFKAKSPKEVWQKLTKKVLPLLREHKPLVVTTALAYVSVADLIVKMIAKVNATTESVDVSVSDMERAADELVRHCHEFAERFPMMHSAALRVEAVRKRMTGTPQAEVTAMLDNAITEATRLNLSYDIFMAKAEIPALSG